MSLCCALSTGAFIAIKLWPWAGHAYQIVAGALQWPVRALLSAAGIGRVSQALTGDVPTGLVLIAAGVVWAAAGFVQKPLELRGQTFRLFAGVAAALLLFLLLAPALAVHAGPTGVALAKLLAGGAYVVFAAVAARATR